MNKRYAAKKALREERERAAADVWHELRSHFADRVGRAADPLSGVVKHVQLNGEQDYEGWVWWHRCGLEQQVRKVQQALDRRYMTQFALHGDRVAGAAEWQSALLFQEAEQKGQDALIAALFITAERSSNWRYDFDPSPDARDALRSAVDQAHIQLNRQRVRTYATARTWFLPRRFDLSGSPQTGHDIVGQLGDLMGEFLATWIPVHVKVEFNRQENSAGPQ